MEPHPYEKDCAFIERAMVHSRAWSLLSPAAQSLYPRLKMEWSGPDDDNNGRIRLSVRGAAKCMGVNKDTAVRAFKSLERHEFIVRTNPDTAGAAEWLITELTRDLATAWDGR